MFFFLLLTTSCNGLSSVYNIYPQAIGENKQGVGEYVFEQDEYDFNEKSLERFKDWYSSLIDQLGRSVDPIIVISDIYNCIEVYNKLPLLGPTGKQAGDRARKVWKRRKQVFGREKEIFSNDRKGLNLIRRSFRNIPEAYKQVCLNMILELVDRLFHEQPKYQELSNRFTDLHKQFTKRFTDLCKQSPERFTDFEQPISQEDKKAYSHAMAYLKKLFMEHSDTINKPEKLLFYSDSYPGLIFLFLEKYLYLCPFPVLFLLAISLGSGVVVNDFLDFCEKQGINVRKAAELARIMCMH